MTCAASANAVPVAEYTLAAILFSLKQGWSLAARGLPWEFEVWPLFAPTAWWYVVAAAPALLMSTTVAAPEGLALSRNSCRLRPNGG